MEFATGFLFEIRIASLHPNDRAAVVIAFVVVIVTGVTIKLIE